MTIEAPRIGALLASRKDSERHLMAHQPRCPATQSEAALEVFLSTVSPTGAQVVRFYVNSKQWWDLVINQVPQNALEGHRR